MSFTRHLLIVGVVGGGVAFLCSEALLAAGLYNHLSSAVSIGLAIAVTGFLDRHRAK